MTFSRQKIIKKINKIYSGICNLYSFLRLHWWKITIWIFLICGLIVWFSQTNSKASLIASAISPVGANLRAGKIDTENRQMLKASNPIYIDAELTSEHQGPVLFWNDKPENIMISIKNTGEKVLSSTAIEGSSYDVLTRLKISYTDTNGLVVDNFERDLRQAINKGDPKWQPIDFPLPKITSWEIQVALKCEDEQDLCDTTRTEPLKRTFELRYDIKDTQIIIIDATFWVGIDNIEVEAFREKFNTIFNLDTEDSEKILRAVYSKNAVQEKTLGGAIILANPAKYHSEDHVLVGTLENIIRQSYTHLSEKIIFEPFDESVFDNKTYLLKWCTVRVDCPNNLGFKNLDPYKNPFSEGIFEANPNLDFLIIIPAASDKKKEN